MTLFDKWWSNGNKNFSIRWMYKIWKANRVGPFWRFRTNDAKKSRPEDTCLDVYLELGYLVFNYTNFDLQGKRRKTK